MEVTNANWKKILVYQDKFLQQNDIVIFTVDGKHLAYHVSTDHLCGDNCYNSQIFETLGLDADKFCEKYYGYKPIGGCWPTFKGYDSATRVVKAIFSLIEDRQEKDQLEKDVERLRKELKSTKDVLQSECATEIKGSNSSIKITIETTQSFKIIL